MAQKSKRDELKSSRDDAALRQEVADALDLPPDDPQVTATLDNLADPELADACEVMARSYEGLYAAAGR